MQIDDQTLLIRTLNASRQSYFPTYVGLRLIGDQIHKDSSGFLNAMVRRRIQSGDKWRFRMFDMYKGSRGSRESIEHEYRRCVAPSPITALAEAYILGLLSESPDFSDTSNVYSYRWPSTSRSGSSYEFFATGYRQRNVDIATLLESPDTVAVVTDIKSFYPSVRKEKITEVLKQSINASPGRLKIMGEGVIDFFDQLMSASPCGIPIGPASAHILGNLSLREADAELSKKFGSNYFRYVDDIVVVCSRSKRQEVEQQIRDCLDRMQFSINEDKTVELDAEGWRKSISRSDISGDDNFQQFSRDLTIYLAFHPGKAAGLKSAFRDAGLCIPIDRFLSLSSYSRYRYFLSRKTGSLGLSHKLAIWMTSERKLVERGIKLKANQLQSLDILLAEPVELIPNLRRWQVQRIRRVVNALFYLRGFAEWKVDDDLFNAVPELVEQRALGQALSSQSISHVLPFFGRGPAAFGELWREYGEGPIRLPNMETSLATVDSLTSLRLQGILPEDEGIFEGSEHRLYSVASPNSPSARQQPDLSFEDEFQSLRLGVSGEDIVNILKTRYSLRESSPLEALSLLSSEYRS